MASRMTTRTANANKHPGDLLKALDRRTAEEIKLEKERKQAEKDKKQADRNRTISRLAELENKVAAEHAKKATSAPKAPTKAKTTVKAAKQVSLPAGDSCAGSTAKAEKKAKGKAKSETTTKKGRRGKTSKAAPIEEDVEDDDSDKSLTDAEVMTVVTKSVADRAVIRKCVDDKRFQKPVPTLAGVSANGGTDADEPIEPVSFKISINKWSKGVRAQGPPDSTSVTSSRHRSHKSSALNSTKSSTLVGSTRAKAKPQASPVDELGDAGLSDDDQVNLRRERESFGDVTAAAVRKAKNVHVFETPPSPPPLVHAPPAKKVSKKRLRVESDDDSSDSDSDAMDVDTSEDDNDQDAIIEDTTIEDAAIEDAAIEDAAIEDAAIEDDAIEDDAVEDATDKDAAAPNTADEDAATEDNTDKDAAAEGTADSAQAADEGGVGEGAGDEFPISDIWDSRYFPSDDNTMPQGQHLRVIEDYSDDEPDVVITDVEVRPSKPVKSEPKSESRPLKRVKTEQTEPQLTSAKEDGSETKEKASKKRKNKAPRKNELLPAYCLERNRWARAFIPTFLRWLACQKKLWGPSNSKILDALRLIWQAVYNVDMPPEQDAINGPAFTICKQRANEWHSNFGSTAIAALNKSFVELGMYGSDDSAKARIRYAKGLLAGNAFLYEDIVDGKPRHTFRGQLYLITLATHYGAIRGAIEVPKLKLPTPYTPWGAMTLCCTAAERACTLAATGKLGDMKKVFDGLIKHEKSGAQGSAIKKAKALFAAHGGLKQMNERTGRMSTTLSNFSEANCKNSTDMFWKSVKGSNALLLSEAFIASAPYAPSPDAEESDDDSEDEDEEDEDEREEVDDPRANLDITKKVAAAKKAAAQRARNGRTRKRG
ncbi:hypothetical protein CONPUDRAFT_158024 [Coniophora puteana RWD-64-598 SS2]|uniref:Uncharacterized protein n=1 Tax=Coniophora puteana (strain RWD-64-598) TaxID=741705 RepID=A0A5M3MC97_CONPW|nr:uncharacterized protein CONPUDRAFT_158024 [Coniophora puteana RWD-64-598 SS2]EIW76872.1 hypothetical protein CONPUDRAFT_158024 [Coniophora puteana RWD-64-598 SS2]